MIYIYICINIIIINNHYPLLRFTEQTTCSSVVMLMLFVTLCFAVYCRTDQTHLRGGTQTRNRAMSLRGNLAERTVSRRRVRKTSGARGVRGALEHGSLLLLYHITLQLMCVCISISLSIYIYIYICNHIYIYIYIYAYVYVYIYIYIYREREGDR